MNSSLFILIFLAALGQADAKLRTLEGQMHSGRLVSVTDNEVVLATAGGEQSFPPARLDFVGLNLTAASSRWKVQVALIDGSVLNGTSYGVLQGKATVTLSDGSQRELPLKSVVSVRLREQTGELARQWAEYLAEEAASDRIVIRRKAAQDDPAVTSLADSLDVMEGVLHDVTDTTVHFDVAGEVLKVKRDRVDGLVYFRGRESAPTAATCFVVDIDDCRWAIRTLQLANQTLKLETPSGVSAELPLNRVRKIDYASGNRRYLSELTRDALVRETWTGPDSEEDGGGVFALSSGRSPEGSISIGGQTYSQSVWMPARTALTVRVPAGFQRFQAQVGIDDRVGNTDGARLLIEADGKVLLDELMKREARLTPVNVDLKGARRVRITVDYGGESFLGDQLVLCEAMFVK